MLPSALPAVALLLAAALLPGLAQAEPGREPTAFERCGGDVRPGLGRVCDLPDGSLAFFGQDGALLGESHGPDRVATGPDGEPAFPGQAEIAAATPLAPTCVAPGTAYSFVAVYARPTDRADRSATLAPLIRSMVHQMNGFLAAEGAAEGRDLTLRFQCSSGTVLVRSLLLSRSSGSDSASTVLDDVGALVGDDPKVKVLVWYDGIELACLCSGIGFRYRDDRAALDNLNNGAGGRPLAAINYGYTGAAGATIFLHEAGHTMGAVQGSAPHASDSTGGHCNDGLDVMCYDDDGDRSDYHSNVCLVARFDCNRDDYFDPTPAPGSYLATHWNIGSPMNRFLHLSALDDDGDGVADELDAFPADPGEWRDTDGDGTGDNGDADDDGDGWADADETACRTLPLRASSLPADRDGDSRCDRLDNCVSLPNAGQANLDLDRFGDACDTDDDGDRIADLRDNCLAGHLHNPAQRDADDDAAGDACDGDDDGDGVADVADVCPVHPDPAQADGDADGVGDACEGSGATRSDPDGDGVPSRRLTPAGRLVAFDTCPTLADPRQADHDGDGRGDLCDLDDDADRLADSVDPAPLDHATWPYL